MKTTMQLEVLLTNQPPHVEFGICNTRILDDLFACVRQIAQKHGLVEEKDADSIVLYGNFAQSRHCSEIVRQSNDESDNLNVFELM